MSGESMPITRALVSVSDKTGLVELGQFLAARGVTPELADALGAIGQSPELVQTLNDPDVRVLMHDPNNLRMLAGMLKQAAQQARRVFDDGHIDADLAGFDLGGGENLFGGFEANGRAVVEWCRCHDKFPLQDDVGILDLSLDSLG